MATKKKRIGTLLPISALVSKTSESGTFEAGERFVDWLAKTKQTAWQMLPLHQTQLQKGSKSKHVSSPYKGYGVGLDPKFLHRDAPVPSETELREFVKKNRYWLETYALFCALRDHFGSDEWSKWPSGVRNRDKVTIAEWRRKLAASTAGHMVVQAQLNLAFERLRSKAKVGDIILIGDMPFYLCLNSPLVWEYQDLFDIPSSGKLRRVSGVLKGVKSHFGRQIWGHPLYLWQKIDLLPKLYNLFKIRFKYLAGLYDLIRFDHTKGLFSYGVIDLVDHKADAYQIGPGRPFLEKLIRYARTKKLKIYAEDTGDKLKELRNCLHIHHLPGVKIFRFAYNEKTQVFADQYLRIAAYPKNTVAYTTTHDTESLLGYLEKLSIEEIANLRRKLHFTGIVTLPIFTKWIREKIIKSPARVVLVPLQDWLLTTERINTPGTEKAINDQNWRYKMTVAVEDLPVDL